MTLPWLVIWDELTIDACMAAFAPDYGDCRGCGMVTRSCLDGRDPRLVVDLSRINISPQCKPVRFMEAVPFPVA